MKPTGHTIPRMGEIRIGKVTERSATHKYTGIHLYLVISNDTYNKTSGQCEVIPFTTKRYGDSNPVHVDYSAGEVSCLTKNSTLVIEGRDTLLNSQLGEPVGFFSADNWVRASRAMLLQSPVILMAIKMSSDMACSPCR